MKLLTLTLAHAAAAPKLPGALASASWADMHLVVDTTPDKPDVKAAFDGIDLGEWPSPILTIDWPWRNDFAAARNELLNQANKHDATWALMLDSDERLVCPDPAALRAELASATVEHFLARYVDGNYAKERAFKLPTTVRYVGRTHECAVGWASKGTLQNLTFTEEGKSAEDNRAKFLRDEKALLIETRQSPRDPRWWYYLGYTQDALGKHHEAVDSYQHCAKLRGWDEEGAWACYQAAKILLNEAENWPVWEEKRSKLQTVIEVCTRGLARHPGFPELCWAAALACFWRGEPHKATMWANMGISIGSWRGCNANKHRTSFRDLPKHYEWPFGILKFSEDTEEKRQAAALEEDRAKFLRWGGTPERLAIDRSSPVRGEARAALRGGPLSDLMPVTVYPIEHVGREDYANLNPSPCVHDGRIVCVVRTVNYHMDDAGNYVTLPEDEGVIKTENWFGKVDVDGHHEMIVNPRPIVDVSSRTTFETRVRGYEDMRPLSVGGKLYASATVRDSRLDMRCEIAVCELEGDTVRTAHLQRFDTNQKNWMPVDIDGSLGFVHWCDAPDGRGTIVARWNPSTGQCDTALVSTPPFALDHLRGGSQLVPIDGGYLAVTHEVVWPTSGKRAYLHRFVRFDKDLRIVGVSDAWYLKALQIEFCSGMCRLDDTRLLLGFGIRDAEAVFAVVSVEDAVRRT